MRSLLMAAGIYFPFYDTRLPGAVGRKSQIDSLFSNMFEVVQLAGNLTSYNDKASVHSSDCLVVPVSQCGRKMTWPQYRDGGFKAPLRPCSA